MGGWEGEDEWMGEKMRGWVDGWMDGQMAEQMDGQVGEWMGGQMDGAKYQFINLGGRNMVIILFFLFLSKFVNIFLIMTPKQMSALV